MADEDGGEPDRGHDVADSSATLPIPRTDRPLVAAGGRPMIRYRVVRSGDRWYVWRDEGDRSRLCGSYDRERALQEVRLRARYEDAVAAGRGLDDRVEILIVGE